MSIVARVVADLRAQLRWLIDDFDQWSKRDRTAHKEQIKRIVGQLETVLATTQIETKLAEATIATIETQRRTIEIIHLIWDFFRDKLMQRDTERYVSHLTAADDLAWSCYMPFATARVAVIENTPLEIDFSELKESPLVFYTTDRSPFAQPRALSFYAPGLTSEDTTLFASALQRLPVPLVGISWPQTLRVAPLVFIAHEVGHVIAHDLGVMSEVTKRLHNTKLDTRADTWLAWADEVVADIFGVLLLGPCYVDQLQRALVGNVSDVRGEAIIKGSPGRYPTRALRVALCEQALERLQLPVETLWGELYGEPDNDSGNFVKDVPAVVGEILDHKFAALGTPLSEVLAWTRDNERDAGTIADDLLAGDEPIKPFGSRILVSAAAKAYSHNPEEFARRNLDQIMLNLIEASRTKGVRSTPQPLRDRLSEALKSHGLVSASDTPESHDSTAGKKLAELLKL